MSVTEVFCPKFQSVLRSPPIEIGGLRSTKNKDIYYLIRFSGPSWMGLSVSDEWIIGNIKMSLYEVPDPTDYQVEKLKNTGAKVR